MAIHNKNKYATPKYRIVVRFSKKDITAQIAYAKIGGDVVVAAAYSHELPRYGVYTGPTTCASAYAAGLLLASRLLKNLKKGLEEQDGGHAPFKAFLDVGCSRMTEKMFAVVRGVVDGGIAVPHGFFGNKEESKDYDTEGHFFKLITEGVIAESIEKMCAKEHIDTNEDSEILVEEEKEVERKRWNAKKLTYAERQSRINTKKAYLLHLKAQNEAQ